jgi:hypothetical protein
MSVLKATLCGLNKVEVLAVKENQQNLNHKPDAVGCFTRYKVNRQPTKIII